MESEIEKMSTLDTQLRLGEETLNRGDFSLALAGFIELTRLYPNSVGAWCGLAAAHYGLGNFENALAAAENAVRLAPHDSRCMLALAPPAFVLGSRSAIETCRAHIGRISRDDGEIIANFWTERLSEKDYFSQAAAAFSIFASRNMDNELIAMEMAYLHINAFQLDEADRILTDCERKFGARPRISAMRARIALTKGDTEFARMSALKAIEMNNSIVPAYVILSEIAAEQIDAAMETRLNEIVVSEDYPDEMREGGFRVLGRVSEKKGDYDRAFELFAAAKALAKQAAAASGVRYDQRASETRFRNITAMYQDFAQPIGDDCGAPQKIFIVGMPRSGSTLVEQILSKHSGATCVGESLNMPRIANWVERNVKESRKDYRTASLQMRSYYNDTYERSANGAKCVIDKNLFNLERCGLIADLDPNARFVLVLREPSDIAVSIFKSKFLAAHPWSNDLRDIAHMQASFDYLAEHWRRTMGSRLLVLRHEELVADFEAVVRRLLEFCGLEFEPQCLAFHEGGRHVFTISAAQVRRPLNADGVGRWRRYERHLDSYNRALAESRLRYDDST